MTTVVPEIINIDYLEAVYQEALQLAQEGTLCLQKYYPPSQHAIKEPFVTLMGTVLSESAPHWVKPFERAIEPYYALKVIQGFDQPIEVLVVDFHVAQKLASLCQAIGLKGWIDSVEYRAPDEESTALLQSTLLREVLPGGLSPDGLSQGLIQTNKRYDLIVAFNVLHSTDNPAAVLQPLLDCLKPQGKLLFNGVTEQFQHHFFASLYQLAVRHGYPLPEQWATGKNYIPYAYDQQTFKQLAVGLNLSVEHVHTYLQEEPFSPYQYFTPCYQLLFQVANVQQVLHMQLAQQYISIYARYLYQLSLSLPGFIDDQVERAFAGASNGCYLMALLKKG